jgi:hypothetical protein
VTSTSKRNEIFIYKKKKGSDQRNWMMRDGDENVLHSHMAAALVAILSTQLNHLNDRKIENRARKILKKSSNGFE